MKDTVNGLVLREVPSGENDKLLTVLTAEHGKILISAKGARSLKSKSLSVCSPFIYGNFEFYEKNGMRWLSGGNVIENFFIADGELSGYALGSYVCEVAAEVSGEGVCASELLRVTLNALYAIREKLKPLEIIKGAYEFYVASLSGFDPDFRACAECGCQVGDSFFLNVMNGSIICEDCLRKSNRYSGETGDVREGDILLPLRSAVVAAVRYILSADPKRLFAFELSEKEDLENLSRAGESYISGHLERGFDTLEFFKAVHE